MIFVYFYETYIDALYIMDGGRLALTSFVGRYGVVNE